MMMRKYTLHALAALNLLLAAALTVLWVGPGGQLRNKVHWHAPGPQTTDYAAMIPPLPGIAPADTSQFIGMLERPLFSPTRRPPPPPPPPEPQAKEPADNLGTAQLTGLFYGPSDGGIIIQMAGKQRRVRLKDKLEGWTLASVQDRQVTFTRGGQTRTLQLPRAALTGAAPAAASPTPAAPGAARPVRQPPQRVSRPAQAATAPAPAPAPDAAAASQVAAPPPARPVFGGGGR